MLDISDGLAGDVGHICEVSGLAAIIEADRVPLSAAAVMVWVRRSASGPAFIGSKAKRTSSASR